MRTVGAVLIGIATLALGFTAISFQAQSVQDTAVTNGSNQSAAAYNATTGIVEVVGSAISPLVLYGGVAALAFIVIGLVAVYGSRGR